MPSLTIKDIPPGLLRRVRARALRDRRSMNGEVIHLLGQALEGASDRERQTVAARASAQADAWAALGGRWRSKLSAAKEIRSIYVARSRGRPVSL